eukprot:206133_1
MADVSWTECIIALFLMLIPTGLCLLVPKKWILKYQRELLTCSLGTIFAIVFVDLIPDLIEDAQKHSDNHPILFSLSIFGGIIFAFTMNAIHDMMEQSHCENCDDNNPCDQCQATNKINHPNKTTNTNQNPADFQLNIKNKMTNSWSCKDLPCQVKVFLAAIAIDFIVDGFIIACQGIVTSIALLPHEFVHVLGDVVFLINCGLGKTQAIIIRLLCQLATPISGCVVRLFQDMWKDTLNTIHTYGHGVIAGMFIYILLIDIFPMIEEGHLESHQHHPYLGSPRKSHSNTGPLNDIEASDIKKQYKKISAKILLPLLFVCCFSMTGTMIYSKDHVEGMLKKWF